jgi:3-oxoacyl-[acyl-carrier protein] reductase
MTTTRPIPAPFSLEGRRALVTGGSRGVGAATARLLASFGVHVGVVYRSRRDDAEAMVAELGRCGVRSIAVSADVGDAEAVERAFDEVVTALGGLELVIHSAGIWPPDDVPVHDLPDARWHRTIRENVDGMFYVSRAAARRLGDGGRIVHISSTAGQRGEAYHADYGASKGAMISFVKSQAIELAARGITVNAVAPGWIDTEMCAQPFAGEGRARIAAGIPNGRIATPEDVAWAAVALCMPGARHLVGEIVNVNGGSILPG